MDETEISTTGGIKTSTTEEIGTVILEGTEITLVATETDSKIEMSTETGAATAVYLRAWPENPVSILRRLASETASPAASLGPSERHAATKTKTKIKRYQYQLQPPQSSDAPLPLLPRVVQFFGSASGLMRVTPIMTITALSIQKLISRHGVLLGSSTLLSAVWSNRHLRTVTWH
jgi:hypothetical protein